LLASCCLHEQVEIFQSNNFMKFAPLIFASLLAFLTAPLHAETIIVTNTNDSGPGSLRQAIDKANDPNTNPGGDTIGFDASLSGQTITVTSAIIISGGGNLNIMAPNITLSVGTGAACRFFTISSFISMSFSGVTFSGGGGATFAENGGAIHITDGSLFIDKCTFLENRALVGGAIYSEKSSLSITNSTFSKNASGGRGGAIYYANTSNNPSLLFARRCTFTQNTSNGQGGALYLVGISAASAEIRSCTISGNQSGQTISGGGVEAVGLTFRVRNSIIAGNREANTASDLFVDGSFSNSTSIIPHYTGSLTSGSTIPLNADPLLGPLAHNGGPTMTMAPQGGSPAINAGSTLNDDFLDQRGFPPLGLADIGAVEACTINPTPNHNAATATPSLFSWSGPAGASYQFYFGSTSGNLQLLTGIPNPPTATSASLFPSAQPFGTSFWRVDVTLNGVTYTGPEYRYRINREEVRTNASDGPGSLRDLLARAKASSGNDTIIFHPSLSGGTCVLTPADAASGLVVDDPDGVTIDATALPQGFTLTDSSDTHRLLYVAPAGKLNLLGLTLKDGGGSAFSFGGAGVFNDGVLQLKQCMLLGNRGTNQGGAIYNRGLMGLIYSTISGNRGSIGGGLYNLSPGTAILLHCTIAQNSGDFASLGGVANEGGTNAKLTLTNCLLFNNGTDLSNSGSTVEFVGSNLIGSTVNSFGTLSGPAPLTADPLLGPLGNYGGSTQTIPLRLGSPARNAATSVGETTDQRGFPIIGVPDLGAYEAGHTLNHFSAYIQETLPHTATDSERAATHDFDGDGHNNFSEWLAQTVPTNPNSFFRTDIQRQSGNFSFDFIAAPSRTYQLQQSTDLISNNWQTIGTLSNPNPGPQTFTTPQTTAPRTFYRIAVSENQ
jgi:predicted outer membrane repeat protein